MENCKVKKAEGKLGVLVVGLGAVSTTFMTGVLMVRKGLAKPVGSMTQYDKIRVGRGENKKYLHYNEIVPMADLNDIVFGAWDVYPANAYESAINAEVLKEKDINPVKDELVKIVPMKAAFDHNYAKRLDGDNVKQCKDRWDMVEQIRADIRKAREKGAEIVTVCIHWGVEYKLVQNKEQEDLAKFLADEGVDLIIGGHPHVIQPMKVVYNARHDKKVLIVYSLGNFVSGMRTADTRGGAMVKVELHRVNGKACLDTAKYKLFFVQEPEKGGSYEVIPADKDHLIRKNVYPLFEKFESNATAIFEKHNIGVEKDAWKWIPNVLIPMFVEEGTEK